MLKLPKNLRSELKKPIGKLYDSIEEVQDDIQEHLTSEKLVIGIGDVTTKTLVELGLTPQICIVDNLIERRPVQHNLDHTDNIVYVENPPGVLTDELIELITSSIKTSTRTNPIIIVVDGEEDLAVLPAILNSPENTYILYGQPKEGVVLVNSTKAYDTALNYYNQLIKE